jgi:hypothetical protein
MSLSKVLVCVFSVVFIFILLALTIGRVVGLYAWLLWWVADAEPVVSKGIVTNVYEYRGRDSGKQRIFFLEKGRGEVILHAALEKNSLTQMMDPSVELTIRYYPVPTGFRYIYYIESNKGLIYEGEFKSSGWAGFLISLICIFFAGIILILLTFLIKNLKERS